VLYTSGHVESGLPRGAEADGVSTFLPKPYVPETLARRVRDLLDEPHASS
jgi:hypothetical protein